MRVLPVTPGPLFPDDGPRGARILRRVKAIGIELVLFVAITLLSPALIVVAAAADLVLWLRTRKHWMALRLLAMLWWFLVGELIALVWLLGIWLGGAAGRLAQGRCAATAGSTCCACGGFAITSAR